MALSISTRRVRQILVNSGLMRELSQSGVIGDATVATKEKGDRLLESLSDGWVQVIQDIYTFRQPQVGKP